MPGGGAPVRGVADAGLRGGRAHVAEAARTDALAPVVAAMLRRAHEQAGEIVAQARRQAQQALAQARRDAGESVSEARDQGRAQAGPLAAAQVARGRREARAILLGAQRQAHEELRARVREAVSALRDEPGYGPLRERLSRLACQVAGPGATASEHPAGGVVARGRGVIVDCSLPRLAEQAVDALGAEVTSLWTPGRRRRPDGEQG